MNPDAGDEAEDWFARFEREAREAARRREAEGGDVPPTPDPPDPPAPAPGPPAPAAPPPAPYPPQYPSQPFPPAAPPPAPPAAPPPLTPPPPVEPPPTSWDQPTQAMGMIEPDPTQAMPAAEEPGQDLVRMPLQPPSPAEPASALDVLFGEDRFREYEPGPDPNESPFAPRARSRDLLRVAGADGGEPPPPREFGTLQKALLGVGGGLLAILVLLGLFVLGTRLPDLLGPAPAVSTSPSPTTTPTALPIGPVDPGTYRWDELLGGECLEPYVDAWQDEYVVVDCADPHGGQLVYRAWFPNPDLDPALDPAAEPTAAPLDPTVRPGTHPYPGAEALAEQVGLLCSAAGVVDLAVAGQYADAQIQGSYPATAEQWDENPSYYCFVSRSSGEPLTGSVAIPREPTQPTPDG